MKMFNSNINVYTNQESFYCVEYNTFTKSQNKPKIKPIWLILSGLIIGFVNGFWGGGGGMICVPILSNLLKLPEKVAHATTLLIMLPLSIASFVVYVLGGSIDLNLAINVGIGFVVGGALGAMLLKNINNIVLRIVFALIIIAGGGKLLI